jgi:hypothetical protein
VKAVAPLTEADPAGVLACLLTGVGNALGRQVHHRIVRRHAGNLFTLLVGSTASRKGTCWAVAGELLEQAAPDWWGACTEGGFGSGEGFVYRIRDTGPNDVGVSDKRLLMIEEEFAKPLRLCRNERSILSPLIRSAFDGSPLSVMNRGENRYGCREPHVSIVGMTTAEELRELVKGRCELANGSINRFLLIECRRAGYLPTGGDYWRVAEQFAPRLREALERAGNLTDPLTLVAEAADLWNAEYVRLEADRPGDYGRATARLSVHALKLASVYAALDGEPVIREPHLRAALSLVGYADQSARNVFGTPTPTDPPNGGGPADPPPARLHRLATSRPDGITRKDAHGLFRNHRKADDLNADFALLEQAGFGARYAGRWYATEYLPTGPTGVGLSGGNDIPPPAREPANRELANCQAANCSNRMPFADSQVRSSHAPTTNPPHPVRPPDAPPGSLEATFGPLPQERGVL